MMFPPSTAPLLSDGAQPHCGWVRPLKPKVLVTVRGAVVRATPGRVAPARTRFAVAARYADMDIVGRLIETPAGAAGLLSAAPEWLVLAGAAEGTPTGALVAAPAALVNSKPIAAAAPASALGSAPGFKCRAIQVLLDEIVSGL